MDPRTLGAGLAVVVAASACSRERPAAGGSTTAPAPIGSVAIVPSAAPSSAPPPVASAAPARERPVTCRSACAPGTSCHLTKSGPACVACAPGSVSACKDDRFVATCSEEGVLTPTIDCRAAKKRCAEGRCVDRACTPNALHCFDGDVHRCDAEGTGHSLATRCIVVDADGSIDASKGVCQSRGGATRCRTDCVEPSGTIVAMRDCEACAWDKVPFCATESPERGCLDWICVEEGRVAFGAVSIPCWRDTEGLVVPGSDRPGTCEGAGPVGSQTVAYEVCRGGLAAAATRVSPCEKP